MPCRALEAFGLCTGYHDATKEYLFVLMPCRALEAFGLALLQEARDLGIVGS